MEVLHEWVDGEGTRRRIVRREDGEFAEYLGRDWFAASRLTGLWDSLKRKPRVTGTDEEFRKAFLEEE